MTIYLWLTSLIIASASVESTETSNGLELAGHHALHRVIREEAASLSAFTTDGCSGGLSSAWRVVAGNYPDLTAALGEAPPWEACCVVHDQAYHAGGREPLPGDGMQDRLVADEALRACVAASADTDLSELAAHYEATEDEVRGAFRSVGEAMFLAVRFGGAPCSGLSWRWGYGSPQCYVKRGDFQD